ncbi:MAG: hypothetical protein LBN00_03575 [Oscillospiraceae bacterium]|nr:hypothetical protein [Oscillospiraceae bacterium]
MKFFKKRNIIRLFSVLLVALILVGASAAALAAGDASDVRDTGITIKKIDSVTGLPIETSMKYESIWTWHSVKEVIYRVAYVIWIVSIVGLMLCAIARIFITHFERREFRHAETETAESPHRTTE